MLSGGGISMYKHAADFSKEILNKSVQVISPQFVGASNPMYANLVGVIKNVYDSYKIKDTIEQYEGYYQNKGNSKSNKNLKFISKIKELIEEFF